MLRKIMVATCVATMALTTPMTTAFADSGATNRFDSTKRIRRDDHREWRHHRGDLHRDRAEWRRELRRDRRARRHHRHRGNDDAIALGLGLAAGAIVLGTIASQQQPTYRAPASGGRYEPWSPSWYRYCDNKYRSFNPNTGTYRGYDGRDHFCVVN
nr:BA14K family protein [Pseudohoeflea sp. DP4N28-3]